MKILFAGKQERGVVCLRALVERGHRLLGVIVPPGQTPPVPGSVDAVAAELGLPRHHPQDVNASEMIRTFATLKPDVTVLGNYGQIVKRPFIDLAPLGCVNLHAGKLPEFRGSSPLNWALIRGETEFTASVIRVDAGVDTGDVLKERQVPIDPSDTINDLHRKANEVFPGLLLEALDDLEAGRAKPRKQDGSRASYYPLRFPDEGLILWDLVTAEAAYNRIRALTVPYPCAFTFYNGERVNLISARLTERPFYGEPGRIYRVNGEGILVAASDQCLWIREAAFAADGSPAAGRIDRYGRFTTVQSLAIETFSAR